MHTYYSALPFTPHDTPLYRLYERATSHTITVLQGLDSTWGPCLSSSSSLSLSNGGASILRLSPDETRLAVSGSWGISILDARTAAIQCYILRHDTDWLAFSPSGGTLVTASLKSKSLELWNTTTGIKQETKTLSGNYFYAATSSSGGQYLLLAMDHSLHLHHGTNANELSVLSTDWRHTTIIFASNDTQVITGSEWGHIFFFKLSSNRLSEIQERRIFNQTGVLGLSTRHDGKR